MAASAACLAMSNGLTRIDHIVLSEQNQFVRKGENVFVVEGALDNPAHRRAHMKTQDAVGAPEEESIARLSTLQLEHRERAHGLASEQRPGVGPRSQSL